MKLKSNLILVFSLLISTACLAQSQLLNAKKAEELNIGLNAGHDLSLVNLHFFNQQIPNLLEVSIGHALICDALYYGLEKTISLYLNQLKK